MIAAAAMKSIASKRADAFLASDLSTFETHSKVRCAMSKRTTVIAEIEIFHWIVEEFLGLAVLAT